MYAREIGESRVPVRNPVSPLICKSLSYIRRAPGTSSQPPVTFSPVDGEGATIGDKADLKAMLVGTVYRQEDGCHLITPQ